jgi:L,D-transpeptidase ErfK/SrfK
MKYFLMTIYTLGALALAGPALAYDKDYIGETESYRSAYEDTLVHLAREHNLGFVEIRAANPSIDPWMPGAGTRVVLPKKHLLPDAPRQGIVINLPEMRLYYYASPGAAPLSYPLGVGREGLNTPTGTTTVTWKRENPTWTPTERMRKEDPTLKVTYPPGPDNPMGTHAMYLGWPTYAIHGTDKPYSVGRRASSGCIRMYPEGIKDLFPRIKAGTQVTVVDQPIKVGWVGDEMYVEVHPTQEQNTRIEDIGNLSSYEITREDIRRINKKAGTYKDHIDWEKVRGAVRDHTGVPVSVLNKDVTPQGRASRTREASAGDGKDSVDDGKAQASLASSASSEQSRAPRARMTNLNN